MTRRRSAASGQGGPVVTDPVRRRFERSARYWLRAYPMRWRDVRGREMVDLLADLAGPRAHRLSARTAVATLAAGWRERWRGHPALLPWLGYRIGDAQLPARYRGWVADDLRGVAYGLRTMLLLFAPAGFVVVAGLVLHGRWGDALPIGAAMLPALGGGLLAPGARRVRAARANLVLDPSGDGLPEGLVPGLVMRERVRARGAWTLAVLTSAAGSSLTWPVLLVRGSAVVAFGVVIVLGLAAAVVAAVRVRRLDGSLPAQPARWLVELPRSARVGAVLVLLGVAAGVATDLEDGWLLQTAVFGVPALAVLPAALVARWYAARAGSDLAAADVLRAVVTGRRPAVDLPVPGLVPGTLAGPVAPDFGTATSGS